MEILPRSVREVLGPGPTTRSDAYIYIGTDVGIDRLVCVVHVYVCVFSMPGQSTAGLVLNAHSVAPVSRAHSPVTWWAAVGVGDVFTLHAWPHPHKRLGLITRKPFNPFC